MDLPAARPKNLGRRAAGALVLGVMVVAGLMIYADVSELTQDLSQFRWSAMAAALALATVNYAIRFWRWEMYLHELEVRVPTGESCIIFVAGFVMSITPGKVGEVFKSLLLFESRGVPIARTAPIVVAERLTDLAALVLLTAIGSLTFSGGWTIAAIGAGLVIMGLATIGIRPIGLALISLTGRLPWIGQRRDRLLAAYESLQRLVRPRPLAVATIMATGSWFLECVALFLIVGGFPDSHLDLASSTFAYSAPTIMGAVALLPGGLGVTEAGMAGLLRTVGHGALSASTAAAATILVRLATLWWAVLLGALALFLFRKLYTRTGDSGNLPESEPDTNLNP